METLCGAVALSCFVWYLEAFAIYALDLSPRWAYVSTTLAVAALVACARDLRRLWRHHDVRATLLAFPALVAWLLLMLLLLRNYSGANWYGDWYEHFERAVFFADHKPLNTIFLDRYVLPARPPMMNLLAAQIFWQVDTRFELLQVVFAYLNALVMLPCVLLAPSLVAGTRRRAWLIAGLLALSPTFMQNGTFTWTKAFAGFYTLTALALYLSAWRRRDAGRMMAAVACMSVAMLVHYSAIPFLLFLGGHYLLCLFRDRPHKWRELFGSAAAGAAIFFTWLGWSLHNYGIRHTFGSNTAVTASAEFTFGDNLLKVAHNIVNTLVPFPLRGPLVAGPAYDPRYPPQGLAYVRDWFFRIYQTSFPAMLGIGGLLIVVWILAGMVVRRTRDGRQRRYAFWMSLVFVTTVVGIAVNGEYDYFGNAHICLQPLAALGLTVAAVGLPHVPTPVRIAAILGLLVDAALGVVLHVHLLQYTFDLSDNGPQLIVGAHLDMGMAAVGNAALKFRSHLIFLGDHAVGAAGLIEGIIGLGTIGIAGALWWLAPKSARGSKRP